MNTSANIDIDPENPDSDDLYDAAGNVTPNGLYDAGGHPVPRDWSDFADYEHSRSKDKN